MCVFAKLKMPVEHIEYCYHMKAIWGYSRSSLSCNDLNLLHCYILFSAADCKEMLSPSTGPSWYCWWAWWSYSLNSSISNHMINHLIGSSITYNCVLCFWTAVHELSTKSPPRCDRERQKSPLCYSKKIQGGGCRALLNVTRTAFTDTDVAPFPVLIEETEMIGGWELEYAYKKNQEARVGWSGGGRGVGVHSPREGRRRKSGRTNCLCRGS